MGSAQTIQESILKKKKKKSNRTKPKPIIQTKSIWLFMGKLKLNKLLLHGNLPLKVSSKQIQSTFFYGSNLNKPRFVYQSSIYSINHS